MYQYTSFFRFSKFLFSFILVLFFLIFSTIWLGTQPLKANSTTEQPLEKNWSMTDDGKLSTTIDLAEYENGDNIEIPTPTLEDQAYPHQITFFDSGELELEGLALDFTHSEYQLLTKNPSIEISPARYYQTDSYKNYWAPAATIEIPSEILQSSAATLQQQKKHLLHFSLQQQPTQGSYMAFGWRKLPLKEYHIHLTS